jgi:hypothetical protein
LSHLTFIEVLFVHFFLSVDDEGYYFLAILFQVIALDNEGEMVQVPQEHHWEGHVEQGVNEGKDGADLGNKVDYVEITEGQLLFCEVERNVYC